MDVNALVELLHAAAGGHGVDHLLDEPRGVRPDDVKAQYLLRLFIQDDLGESLRLQHGLALGDVVVVRPPHDNMVVFLRLLLAHSHRGNLRVGIDGVGYGAIVHLQARAVDGVVRGDGRLAVGHVSEHLPPVGVPHGEDIRHVSFQAGVHLDKTALVQLDTGLGDIE